MEELNSNDGQVLTILAHHLRNSNQTQYVVDSVGQQLSRRDFNDVIISCFYGCISVTGFSGNICVIIRILRQLCSHHKRESLIHAHMLYYILALSIIDSLVLTFLPTVIYDILQDSWIFGSLVCRLLWTAESLNKLMSAFILAALSGSCYVAVCKPVIHRHCKSANCSIFLLIIFSVVSLSIITPIFVYSGVFGIVYRLNNTDYIYSLKCLFDPPDGLITWFTLYVVGTGFCFTGVLQIIFYASILRFLYRHQTRCGKAISSSIPFWRIAKKVMILVAFYFTCWTPYWSLTVYIYCVSMGYGSSHNNALVRKTFVYLIHALPYINAALNSTLYSHLLRLSLPRSSVQAQKGRRRNSIPLAIYHNVALPLTKLVTEVVNPTSYPHELSLTLSNDPQTQTTDQIGPHMTKRNSVEEGQIMDIAL